MLLHVGVKRETGYQNAELWSLDLADFAPVRSFADKFEQDGGRLDVLVENAAVTKMDYEATKDGWEMTLQVNFLSTALVALLLLPRMLQTAREHATAPRIVVVTSELHHFGVIPKEVFEKGNVLTTIGSAEYCTKEYVFLFFHNPLPAHSSQENQVLSVSGLQTYFFP